MAEFDAIIVIIILIISCLIGLSCYSLIDRHQGFGKATLINALVVDNQVIYTGGLYFMRGRLFLFAKLREIYHTRLVILNTETGVQQKKKVIYRDYYDIVMVINGIAWLNPLKRRVMDERKSESLDYYKNVKLLGLDIFSWQIAEDETRIKQKLKIPESVSIETYQFDFKAAKIRLTTNAGENYEFDCASTSASNSSKLWVSSSRNPIPSFAKFQGSPPFDFVKKKDAERYHILYAGKIIYPENSFIRPIWLHTYLIKENIKGMVFYHLQTLEDVAKFTLSLVGVDGTMKWSTPQEILVAGKKRIKTPELFFAGDYKNLIVFGLNAGVGQDKLFALDKNNGEIIWQRMV